MEKIVQDHGVLVSVVMVLIIFAFALWGYLYIRAKKNSDELLNHRGFIEMIPSLVSTLGVLGTFAGITLGLLFFDTSNLSNSIPLLLNGLKTAFFTSLAGMIGSLFLSSQVNKLFDEKTGGVNDSAEAAGIVVKELHSMKEAQGRFYDTVSEQLSECGKAFSKMSEYIEVMNVRQQHMYINTEEIKNSLEQYNQSNSDHAESMLQTLGNMEELDKKVVSKYDEQQTRLGELLDHTEALVSGQGEIAQHVAKFGDLLHGEIVEVEDKMTETNNLLTRKFDEFSDLLRKSNTEALVEVMKNVTEEFQKQMNALINKLIQENFEQLNKSVERLNTWQQENKSMIQSLTLQYRQMAENFEQTSTSLTKVDEDTRQLVSEGGKLRQIVDALNKVIVEDEKFIKISSDLQSTTALTKSNFEQFDASTRALNEWVKKQRNFVDGVMVLVQKLEELNKIRDYSEQFWKETREQMNEGVGIIKGGTESLNRQVAGLNTQFYARLSSTLTELDNCIQAFATKAENR